MINRLDYINRIYEKVAEAEAVFSCEIIKEHQALLERVNPISDFSAAILMTEKMEEEQQLLLECEHMFRELIEETGLLRKHLPDTE